MTQATENRLRDVLRRNDTWRGQAQEHTQGSDACRATALAGNAGGRRLSTGHPELDAALKGGGWPLEGTIEVLSDNRGLGAMGLFLPALQSLARQQRWLVFVAPPCDIYAPLLAGQGIDTRRILLIRPDNREDLLWGTEQALHSSTCSAVFSWLPGDAVRYAELRRLQLAATASDTLSVLFRPAAAAADHAPASLRLQARDYPRVEILKQRGSHRRCDFRMPLPGGVPQRPQLWRAGTTDDASPAEVFPGRA